jgi:hypothetical protein
VVGVYGLRVCSRKEVQVSQLVPQFMLAHAILR